MTSPDPRDSLSGPVWGPDGSLRRQREADRQSAPPEYLADLQRQVNDAHSRYTQAVADATRAQLLLLCYEMRIAAPEAAALVFEPSDQGDFLDLTHLYDADGRIIHAPEYGWDDNGRSWDLDTDRPASRAVWEPLARDVSGGYGRRWAINIEDVLQAPGLGRDLDQAIVMADDTGIIIALACPHCSSEEVAELDRAERWNPIEVEDGALCVNQIPSNFETESLVCSSCGTHLDAPVEAYEALAY